jgi:hypothetical protein
MDKIEEREREMRSIRGEEIKTLYTEERKRQIGREDAVMNLFPHPVDGYW